MWIKPKRFLFFLFSFGSDLYHPCFSNFFKLFLCKKHVFWVFSWLISRVCSVMSLRVQFSWFSTLDREFCDCLVTVSWVRLTSEIPTKFSLETNQQNYQRKFSDQFLKGISWVIYFNLLPSSPKPLFSCLYIKTQLKSSVFHFINISKIIFNSFHWFWSLDYVFGGFMFRVGIFSNGSWKT